MDGVQLPQGLSHFEKAVYFLALRSQALLVLIFYQHLKDEQHNKYRNLIQKRSIGPYVAKMLFPQVDEDFWLYYSSV